MSAMAILQFYELSTPTIGEEVKEVKEKMGLREEAALIFLSITVIQSRESPPGIMALVYLFSASLYVANWDRMELSSRAR